MYVIKTDINKKLIHIVISGFLQIEEVMAYVNELEEVFQQFDKGQMLVLVEADRLDPVPQECIPEFSKATECVIKHAKKVAAVHKRTVTQMQVKRMEQEVNKSGSDNIKIMRFRSKQEAVKYLFS